MSSNEDPPDYRRVSIPADSPAEYTFHERRAEILQLMCKKGSPDLEQTQAELATRYNVSQQQISKDFKRIRKSVRHHFADDIELRAHFVFDRAVTELQDQGDHYQAAQLMEKWLSWLGDLGHLNRTPERQEIEHSGEVAAEPPGEKVTIGLPEKNRKQFDELIAAAERETAATRVEENGDDLSPEDLGIEPANASNE